MPRRRTRSKLARKKFESLIVESLETRRLFASVSWISTLSGDWNDPGNWSGGAVPGPADNVTINAAAGVSVIIYSTGVNSVASLTTSNEVNDEGDLTLTGGLTLTGATLDLGGSLDFEGTQNIGGDGAISLRGGTLAEGEAGTGGTLTIGSSISISGGGQIDASVAAASIVNQATITVDVNNYSDLTISAAGDPFVNTGSIQSDFTLAITGPWSNSGTIANSNGTLDLGDQVASSTNPWTNTGTITSTGTGNATVNIGGDETLSDLGSLTTTGSTAVNITGVLDLGNSTLALNSTTGPWTLTTGTVQNGTITGDATNLFDMQGGTITNVTFGSGSCAEETGQTTVNGGLTLSGTTLTLSPVQGYGELDFFGTQTLAGTGTVALTGGSGLSGGRLRPTSSGGAPATFTISPGITIRGAGDIEPIYDSISIVNDGVVDATGGTIYINFSAFSPPGAAGVIFANNGTLQATSEGDVDAENVQNSATGILSVDATSVMELAVNWTNNGQFTASAGSSVIFDDTYTFTPNLGNFTATGANIDFNGAGAAGNPQILYAASTDVGNSTAGLGATGAYGNITIGPSTYVKVELPPGATGTQAVYASFLTEGGTLDLNNLNFYAETATSGGTVTNGSITFLAPPNRLAFDLQPVDSIASQLLSAFTVDVEDNSGNLLTTDSSGVTISIGTGPTGAVLSGTTTVAAVNGIATFSDVSLSTAGTYTLEAADGADILDSSSTSFDISAAASLPGTAGDLYVSGQHANEIYEVSPYTGAILGTVPADGGDAAGIRFDSSGNLDVVDYTSGTVNQYSSTGAMIGTVASGISDGYGLAVADGQTYVCDSDASRIDVFDAAGTQDNTINYSDFSNFPLSLAVTPNGKLLVGTRNGSQIDEVNLDGSSPTVFATGSELSGGIFGLAYGANGNLYASNATNNDILELDPTTGALITTLTGGGLEGPVGIAFSSSGDLYVANGNNNTISVFDLDGQPVTTFTGFSGVYDLTFASSTTTPSVTKLAFTTEPTPATITGALSTITVQIENSSGNVITSDNSTVSLATVSGTSTGGTTATAVAVNGIATFSNLSITTAGTYSFIATDGSDTSATSTSFTIYAPPKTVGALDPSFGSQGLVSHDVGFSTTDGTAQDGTQSVIIGTIGTAPNRSFGITRYNSDGSLDTSFGTAGVTSSSLAGTDDVPTAVDVLASGEILVAGTVISSTESEFVVAEFTAAGVLDTRFGGGNGFALVSFAAPGGTSADVLRAMAVSSTGIIYLGGETNAGGANEDFAIASLTAAGLPSAGFGGGEALQDFAGGDDVINSLAVQSNGDVVAAGSATVGGMPEIALARFLPTGFLDKHFGVKGLLTTRIGSLYDSASSVILGTRGQIIVGGLSASGAGASLSCDFVVARYTSAGRLDRSFGNGPVITRFGQPSAVTQIALDANGNIIASGKTIASLTASGSPDIAIARYTTRGVLDTSFNGTGKTIIDLSAAAVVTTDEVIVKLDASTLGAAFDAFTTSDQGVISITPGGEILAAGNSGSNTVEAELVSAGVDLTTNLITTLPTAVTGGTKSKASITINEAGTDQAAGPVTIDLEVATDALGDGATTFATIPEKIKLRESQSHLYRISFTYPASVSAGNYYLVAVVDNGSTPALADLNTENNLSASKAAVNIAPPFISLAGSGLVSSSKFVHGKPVQVTFTLVNGGNVTAKGGTTANFFLSTDQTAADGTSVDLAKLPINLVSQKPKPFHASFKLPATLTPGTYYLIAVIDPTDSLGSIDQTSSTIVDPTLVNLG